MDEKAAQTQGHRVRPAPAVVVMGVAGCGKSAVGEALAAALGAIFVEGDRLHPPENVA
ncbi:MAG: gluconokinase, partial [Mesorhizobium sp.]